MNPTNEINFLPQSFLQQQARQQRKYRHAVLVGLAALALCGLFTVQQGQAHLLGRELSNRQREIDALRQRLGKLDEYQLQFDQLQHQLSVQREIIPPLTHTSILASLSKIMSTPLAVTDLSMRTGDRTSSSRRTGSAAEPQSPQVMKIDIIGLSPSDVEVANFVGQLTECSLFTNVKMHYSRSRTVGKFEAREFRLELDVRLDRDYRPIQEAEEVASAD